MATNRQILEGEAELTRLLRWVDRRTGGSEGEAMDLPPIHGLPPGFLDQAVQTVQMAKPMVQQAARDYRQMRSQGTSAPRAIFDASSNLIKRLSGRGVREGEAELEGILWAVDQMAAEAEAEAGEAMLRTDPDQMRRDARLSRAHAVLQGARALEARERARMGRAPNEALRDLNRAFASQERAQAVIKRWRGHL